MLKAKYVVTLLPPPEGRGRMGWVNRQEWRFTNIVTAKRKVIDLQLRGWTTSVQLRTLA
jgi:hypothetical protein